ncbi:P-loop NTPase fold protein [Dactylosporangium sp. McL0621]|uniref:P-loop NTPase fold protein n=1 Tax=Dactylosporangium sp. McL0621 TaxID=3415678 RepID=UPI003CEEE4EA
MPPDRIPLWQRAYERVRPTVPLFAATSPPARRPRYPGYSADFWDGPDLLGRAEAATALAMLISSRHTRPPLSIGVFGDWGTGKSFFMECLQREIRLLNRLSAASPPDAPNAMCREVRQIVFNAWHYTDANLWPSLVAEIFAELAEPRTGESREDAALRWQAERERLVGELETTRSELVAAEQRLEAAEVEAERLQATLADLEERRTEGRDALAVLTVVAGTVLDDPAVHRSLEEARRQVDLAAGYELEQLGALTDDGVSVSRRVLRLWRMLVPGNRDAIRWRLWAYGIAAALLCLGLPIAMAAVTPGAVQLLSGLLGLLVPLVLAGRAALAVLGRALGAAERAAHLAGEVRRRLAEQRSAQERAVLDELERLAEQEAVLRHEILAAQARVDEAERALDEVRSGRQLTEFVQERSASADYRSQLGTIAMIRRDFQRLDELLERTARDGQEAAIDRIVLYIDDLDRCPPDRVVDVLQAVHLLLGLRLFVVVVAVDPRWLLSSLELHFERVLGHRRGTAAEHWAATPTNYLEKIFQIPYRLTPMDDAGFGRLVDHLASPGPAATPVTRPAPDAADPPPIEAPDPEPVPADQSRLDPGWLTLSPPEVAFVRRLRRVVATPRAGKRVLNLYRLIRTTLPAVDDHRGVLLLLGIIVGAPTQAQAVFSALLGAPDPEPWYDVVARALPDAPLLRAFGPLREDSGAVIAAGALKPLVPIVAQYSFHTAPRHD